MTLRVTGGLWRAWRCLSCDPLGVFRCTDTCGGRKERSNVNVLKGVDTLIIASLVGLGGVLVLSFYMSPTYTEGAMQAIDALKMTLTAGLGAKFGMSQPEKG